MKRQAQRRRSRGFSLIELMIVVAIIGVLASTAIPSFNNFYLRSKRTERDMNIRNIHKAINDYWIQHGKLPGGTSLALAQNPTTVPTAKKGVFDPALGDWKFFAWRPDGPVYYRYSVSTVVPASIIQVTAIGDLDGDLDYSRREVLYRLSDGIWQELPAPLSTETGPLIY